MSADDRVHRLAQRAGHLDDLAGAVGRPVTIAEGARVRDHHHVIGAACAQAAREAVHDRGWREKAQVGDVGCTRGGRREDGRQADDADPDRPALHERVGADPRHRRPIREAHVGAEDGVSRVAHAGAERVLAPVELVIAKGTRGEADRVEHRDHRPAECEVGCWRALELIAAVQDDRLTRRRGALRLCAANGRGEVRGAASANAVHVGTCLEGAVHVVGGDDAEACGRSSAHRPSGAAGSGRRHDSRRVRILAMLASHLVVERCHRRRRLDSPVRREIVGGHDGAASPHFLHQQLADVLLLVIHDRRTAEHPEAAAARLPVVVQRHREAVLRHDGASAYGEPSHALAGRARDVQGVVGARDDVEAEPGDQRIDGDGAIARGAVVARTLLQVRAQLRAGDADGPERIVVRVQRLQPSHGDRARIERGVE